MATDQAYCAALLAIVLLGMFTLYGALKNLSPYGRLRPSHKASQTQGRELTLPSSVAWLLFESPQLFAFALTFWLLADGHAVPALVLFALWQAHYLYRGLIYPLRRRDRGKRFPLLNVIFGFLFNLLNGYANGYAVSHAAHLTGNDWFATPWFIIGLLVAGVGWWINFDADNRLIALRSDGSTGYRIPQGGLFRQVSAANYFGEILLWSGWALMSLSWAGLVFVLFTLANLVPRAWASHQWYRAQFAAYPAERKVLIPYLW